MKKKTINAIICKKFDEFLASITDEKVKILVNQNTIITGGCIASMLLKEDVNDFDLYFTNKKTVKAVAEYYVNYFNDLNDGCGYVADGDEQEDQHGNGGVGLNLSADRIKIIFKSNGVASAREKKDSTFEEEMDQFPDGPASPNDPPAYRPVYLSCNAITLSNQVQIIIRFYGDAKTVHENFDYVHCTNYWTSEKREVVLNQDALESILAKELKYVGSKYPLASIIRTRKFIQRQWTINAGQYLKMCFQLSKLNLEDINVLEDQLVGVDVAYFLALIDALREKKSNDSNFKLEYNYLSTIIDKMF